MITRWTTVLSLALAAPGAALASEVPFERMTKGVGTRVEWRVAGDASFHQSVRYSPGDTIVRVERAEKDGAIAQATWREWDHVTTDYAAEVRVTSIAYRNGGDELYVAGVTEAGVSEINLWTFGVERG